jgi:hypothetical protein
MIIALAVSVVLVVGMNVGATLSCKMRAMAAGYTATEVQELCK